MKILFLTNHSFMFWQFRRELVMKLLELGHEVYISTPFEGREIDLEALGCHMVRTKFSRRSAKPWEDLGLYCVYRRMLKKIQPDYVITYSIKPNTYGAFACESLGIPYAVNVQGLGTAFEKKCFRKIAELLYRFSCRKAHRIFFENEVNAGLFIENGIAAPEKTVLLSGAGVNTEYYSYHPYPDAKPFRFLFMGRIMKEKGMDELLEAAHRLYQKYPGQFVLDIVGFFEEARYEEPVQHTTDYIAYHSFTENALPYYQACGCVVLPSYHEGMSNVLLESSSTGRPVITADVPGCREAVDDGVTGFLCQCKDVDSLLHAMERILQSDDPTLEEMGRKAREKMLREFQRSNVVNKVIEECGLNHV